MAGTAGRLTDSDARAATAGAGRRKLSDGRGLYLHVSPAGCKTWRSVFRFRGRSQSMSIGPYPEVSLEAARARHAQLKALAASGADPAGLKREGRLPALQGGDPAREGPGPTFRDLAEGYLERQGGRVSAASLKMTEVQLETHLYPALGGMRAADVRREDVARALAPLAAAGRDQHCADLAALASRVFRHAIYSGRAGFPDPAAGLARDYPPGPDASYAAVTEPGEFGRLLADIDAYRGSGASDSAKAALRLAPYVFVSPAELAGAEWAEMDLEGGAWTVREGRAKAGRPHVVPLSRQARELEPYRVGRLARPGQERAGRGLEAVHRHLAAGVPHSLQGSFERAFR
jgi:integrase